MNIKIYLYVILINIFYCISYDNNIYQLSSSTRNSALGDIKIRITYKIKTRRRKNIKIN